MIAELSTFKTVYSYSDYLRRVGINHIHSKQISKFWLELLLCHADFMDEYAATVVDMCRQKCVR